MAQKKLEWQKTRTHKEWGADNIPGKRYISFFVSCFDGHRMNIDQPDSEDLWQLISFQRKLSGGNMTVCLGIFRSKERAMDYAENFLADI